MTVASCKSLCSDNYSQCRTFTFVSSDEACYLKFHTALDFPDKWRSMSNVDTYLRTCV